MIGIDGFMKNHPLSEQANYGMSTRMGVKILNLEIGLKSFYTEVEALQAYGVSLYSLVPVQKLKKWEFFGQAEGGLSFVFNKDFGSERAFQMGIGPGVKYHLRDYFSIDLRCEYLIFANITIETPHFTQMVLPSIGWSVKI
jgi:hypothetical protein